MPEFVVLYKFTDQGRKKIKDTVKRAKQVRKENEARGFKVIGTWWTQGQYDLVAVLEAPTDNAMLSGLFNIAETGNVTSETLRAYTQAEMEAALKAPRRKTAARRGGRTAKRTTRTARKR